MRIEEKNLTKRTDIALDRFALLSGLRHEDEDKESYRRQIGRQ